MIKSAIREVESKQWFRRYPSDTVSWRIDGDEEYARRYFGGEAKSLLFELKTLMTTGNLDQMTAIRRFIDGTEIRIVSLFGHDYVHITVPPGALAEGLADSCTITLYNVPATTQPHRYPGVIGKGGTTDNIQSLLYGFPLSYYYPVETEGVDYIETEYSIKKYGCNDCEIEFLEGCDQYAALETGCSPFKYKKPSKPYKTASMARDECPRLVQACSQYYVNERENHCLWSDGENCFGEIIEHEKQKGKKKGKIRWKAYTEFLLWNPYLTQFTRSGLGYMKLKVGMIDASRKEVCYAEEIVTVDCCEKNANLRVPEIWWDLSCVGAEFMEWGGITICEAADLYDPWTWWRIGDVLMYNLPEITGACLPYVWELNGPGSLENLYAEGKEIDYGQTCWYLAPPDIWQEPICTPAVITVTDRCGNSDKIELDCCKAWAGAETDLTIGYDTLLMWCGESQTVSVGGGCPPYTWTTTSGSITPEDPPFNYRATLTAPASNYYCGNNPTVTVTDCCGNTAQLYVAANCYVGGTAFQECQGSTSSPFTAWSCSAGYILAYNGQSTYFKKQWDCTGTITSNCSNTWTELFGAGSGPCAPLPWCPGAYVGSPDCCHGGMNIDPLCTSGMEQCYGDGICGQCPGIACGFFDTRTALMLAGGCCPVDPYTGLPYD